MSLKYSIVGFLWTATQMCAFQDFVDCGYLEKLGEAENLNAEG